MTNPTASSVPSLRGRSGGRLEMLTSSLFLLPMSIVGIAVIALLASALSVVAIWVGIPIAMAMIYFTRHVTDIHRLWFGRRFGVRIERPYRDLPENGRGFTGHLRHFLALLADPQTWRDQAWLAVNATLGLTIQATIVGLFLGGLGSLTMGLWWGLLPATAEFHVFGIPNLMLVTDPMTAMTYGIPAGLVYLAVWWMVTPALMRAHLQVARVLLGEPEPPLAEKVARLGEVLAR